MRSNSKHLASALVSAVVASLAMSSPAHAQMVAPPSPGLPQTMVISLRSGDASTASAGLPLDVALLPLRSSLGSASMPPENALPGCREKSEENGNTHNYMPLNRATAIHLIPNLTLAGFSTAACPVNAVAGLGLVYTAPIRKNLWLVGSAGTTILPTTTFRRPTPGTNARIDFVWQATPSNAFTFGVGRRGVLIGGAF